jgi:hypothetical protein
MAQTTRPASCGPVFVVDAFPVPRLRRVQQKKVLVNIKKTIFKKKHTKGSRRVASRGPALLLPCQCCCVAVSIISAATRCVEVAWCVEVRWWPRCWSYIVIVVVAVAIVEWLQQ